MVKINVMTDCNNAPKKEFLRDFELAFPYKNSEVIMDSIDESIQWEMVGDKVINGKEEAKKILPEMLDGSMEELTIENIITHGDVGSVNGTMKFTDGSVFYFCDVFTFTSHTKDAKIKKLISFVMTSTKSE